MINFMKKEKQQLLKLKSIFFLFHYFWYIFYIFIYINIVINNTSLLFVFFINFKILRIIRDYLQENDFDRIKQIIKTLNNDFAYSIVPNSRNGGLISLAAAAIALGPVNYYI